jgi:hypothetical protein
MSTSPGSVTTTETIAGALSGDPNDPVSTGDVDVLAAEYPLESRRLPCTVTVADPTAGPVPLTDPDAVTTRTEDEVHSPLYDAANDPRPANSPSSTPLVAVEPEAWFVARSNTIRSRSLTVNPSVGDAAASSASKLTIEGAAGTIPKSPASGGVRVTDATDVPAAFRTPDTSSAALPTAGAVLVPVPTTLILSTVPLVHATLSRDMSATPMKVGRAGEKVNPAAPTAGWSVASEKVSST